MSPHEPHQRVFEVLSQTQDASEDIDGAVLVQYAAVAEWMTPDGERWLSLVDGAANGDRLYRWQVQGMLFNVMHDPAWHHAEGGEEN